MPDPKKVFLVHGRDLTARDQMVLFLRALGLEPMQWEETVAHSGSGSPHNLDVVRSGLAECQCALVLLTPDERVQLREDLGREPPRYQPRPNVLFEAGWAVGVLGLERTVVVAVQEMPPTSDLAGVNYVVIDDSAPKRHALRQRLEAAGCATNAGSGAYLNTATAGNFSGGPVGDFRPPQPSTGGVLTDVVADSALTFMSGAIELYRDLSSDLRQGATIDLKHHYLGVTCASAWMDLSQHPEYGHQELLRVLDELMPEVTGAAQAGGKTLDLVSLGSGDGEVDAVLLRSLTRRPDGFGTYFPIDISFELLQRAVARVAEGLGRRFFPRPFRLKAIHGDFTRLRRLAPVYSVDDAVNFFALIGYTLGNYNEAELLASIRDGMQPGDYLLLDARLHQATPRGSTTLPGDEQELLLKAYRNQFNERFAFGPVERNTTATVDAAKFEYNVNRMITTVPGAWNVVTSCVDVDTVLRRTGERVRAQRLNLASTTLYAYEDLSRWLSTRGFELPWQQTSGQTGLFLLKRPP